MTQSIKKQTQSLKSFFKKKILSFDEDKGEITITFDQKNIIESLKSLRDRSEFDFKQLIDLCGVDYQDFKTAAQDEKRFCVVYHLLSLRNNQRLRVKVFADDDEFPIFPTMTEVWPNADWYEREAFDLFGLMFIDHPDLRRLLTDYGFVGHPFRKDFPMIGKVEVRYDPTLKRVIYEPVSIDERNNVPRLIRDEGIHRG
ncbi:NADH-quinone oxidoreductase subunit C [Methylophilaceae bacterium]|nr:NADH-quinone oxidoreductase subunit C [Methylophilaceae bacterium]|tara:strand:- start:424 stop:1020 length:597 start_codon:yes stop_codon:yes gene_type:complete